MCELDGLLLEWHFFVCFWLTVSFIVLKFTDFQMKKIVGSLDGQSHVTVELYTEPCAGETTTPQLLPAQLYTLQTKEKDEYLEFTFKLACNQMQLKNSTSMYEKTKLLNTLRINFCQLQVLLLYTQSIVE